MIKSLKKLSLDIDVFIGSRIFLRRKELKMSGNTLAKHLDISSQQISKYERGLNSVSAQKILELSKVLQVPILYFYPPSEEFGKSIDFQKGVISPENYNILFKLTKLSPMIKMAVNNLINDLVSAEREYAGS